MCQEELKGKKDGNCNRTDCQKPGATWYNHGTSKWYCEECAEWLSSDMYNKMDAMRMFGHDLCTHKDDEITIKALGGTIEVMIVGDAGEGHTSMVDALEGAENIVVVDDPFFEPTPMQRLAEHSLMYPHEIELHDMPDYNMYIEPNFMMSNTVQKGKRNKKKKKRK